MGNVNLDHSSLVLIGERWLKSKLKFPIVASELKCVGSREIPDVLGFRSHTSILIECKTSRSDFLADAKKPERNGSEMGVGNYRVYLTPKGLLSIDEIPNRWGLIEVDMHGNLEITHFLKGNIFCSNSSPQEHYETDPFFHKSDMQRERAYLYSLLIRK